MRISFTRIFGGGRWDLSNTWEKQWYVLGTVGVTCRSVLPPISMDHKVNPFRLSFSRFLTFWESKNFSKSRHPILLTYGVNAFDTMATLGCGGPDKLYVWHLLAG